MAGNLEQFFGSEGFTQLNVKPIINVDSPDIQLRNAMIQNGLEPPDMFYFDGRVHRFHGGGKNKHDKTCWYVLFRDPIPAGSFGDWRLGSSIIFRADTGRELSAAEQIALTNRQHEAKKLRDEEIERERKSASDTADIIWNRTSQIADENHPYLSRKNIQHHGARVTGDGRLIVPLMDEKGKITSLQYIAADGEKRYHPSGETKGKFWLIGEPSQTIYIAEGFATASSIYEATGQMTVISYSASNLVPVTEIIRSQFPQSKLVIVADNDVSGVGLKYADQASAKYGAEVVMPPDTGDANDYVNNGGDLKALLAQKDNSQWLVSADDFSKQPSPISWLVKGWLQDEALIMVHGPSGGGKTFVVLDWCMTMASSMNQWFGNKVKDANVVYLAGEGHAGLRGRVAAWKQHNSIDKLSMWISQSGIDLNTPQGFHMTLQSLNSLPVKPDLIVVDTLHRFLNGDENSSQDTKTMLDACANLMNEFKCSVLLVHHTGVSEEAQHRARGSSAWRGALEIEISVIPAKNDEPMQIVQRKSKDAELSKPLYCNLQSVEINGWLDDDNEPVKSAVIVQADAPNHEQKDSKFAGFMKEFQEAWIAVDMPTDENGAPTISRSALKKYLIDKNICTESSSKHVLNTERNDKLIGALIVSNIIECKKFNNIPTDFYVINEAFSAQLLMQKMG